jgi:hypothetical protein
MSKDTIQTDDQDIWNRLHDELYERRTAMTEMSEQIAKLRCERDTARRMYCSEVDNTRPHGIYAEDIAKSMGWDCYKKEETK